MGNLVDSVETQPAEEVLTDSGSSDSLEFNADEVIIDLDAPEYGEYLKHKRRMSRSEGNLNDMSYLQWIKTNNTKLITSRSRANLLTVNERTSENSRRLSAPITVHEFYAVKKNSEECEKRKLGSKQRIKDIKKKYNLKDRDYAARTCTYQWNEEDEKEIRKEREERKKLRQHIRNKYNLPTPSVQRITAVASG